MHHWHPWMRKQRSWYTWMVTLPSMCITTGPVVLSEMQGWSICVIASRSTRWIWNLTPWILQMYFGTTRNQNHCIKRPGPRDGEWWILVLSMSCCRGVNHSQHHAAAVAMVSFLMAGFTWTSIGGSTSWISALRWDMPGCMDMQVCRGPIYLAAQLGTWAGAGRHVRRFAGQAEWKAGAQASGESWWNLFIFHSILLESSRLWPIVYL